MISLRRKLWLGFAGLLAILLTVGVLAVVVFTRYSTALERVFRENYDSAVYCDGMNQAIDQLNTRAKYLVGRDDSAARGIDKDAEAEKLDRNLQLQLRNSFLPGELERTQQIAQLFDQFKSPYRSLDGESVDRKALYAAELLPRIDNMKQLVRQIADMNFGNMAALDKQVKVTLVSVRNGLTALIVAGTLLAALVVWFAGAAVVRALRTVTRSAQQIEAGDLDLKLEVKTRDEIGQISEALNSMAARFREFRRLDHHRLARTQQTTQLAIDSLPDAVFVIGPDGRVEISNRTASTHFNIVPGSTVDALRLRWLTSLYESIKLDHKPIEPQGYKGAIQLFEEGHERFLLPRAVPMLSDTQELIGVTVILVDVTHLRHADEAKSSVISTVSHELRTPLTGVRMSLSLLASNNFGSVTTEQKQLITASREESDRLYRIIENLLNISRIESGRSQFQFRPMKPAEIVTNAVDPLRPLFAESKVQLELSIPPLLPNVTADAPSIGSALTNLITNAIKFTPAGGQVRVSCEANGDNQVTFRVADTGEGIPAEYRGRIFEKFFRIPRKSGPAGAGLGLTIAQEIIDAHGGKIGFSCPEAGGTVFEFQLPAATSS